MNLEELAEEFLEFLDESESTAILTGAGVSTASGIPDFRGPQGLYKKLPQYIFDLDFSCHNRLSTTRLLQIEFTTFLTKNLMPLTGYWQCWRKKE